MKKLFAIVLTLCMITTALPAVGVGAADAGASGGSKLHKFVGEEQVLVSNSFENAAQEGIPTTSSANFRTASSEGYKTSTWTINNNMYIYQDVGPGGGVAMRFLAADATAFPGAQLSLNEQFFGVDVVGEPESVAGYKGLDEGVVLTEFDIRTDALVSLALMGTGTTRYDSTANTSGDAMIFKSNGYVGNSNKITYTTGEWAKVQVYTNLTEKYMGLYYNGVLVHAAPTTYGYGVKELWDRYGIMFQASEGMVNFAIDNFKITYSNATHLGYANFDGFTLPATNTLDGAFLPRNYSPVNDLGNGAVTVVEGQNGKGDDAIHLAVNGAANPNFKFYYQNKSYKAATTGLLHGSFDIKFDDYFDVGLSGGFGIYFSDQIFKKDGTVGSLNVPYSLDTWHHVDIVSDWDENNIRMYIDGTLFREGTIPYSFLREEYLQILVWGRNDAANGDGVAIDNVNFIYYPFPVVKSVSSKVEGTSSYVTSFVEGATKLKLTMTKAYTNIVANDVKLAINGEAAECGVDSSGADVILSVNTPLSLGDVVDITILSTAIIGNSTMAPQGYDYSVSYTAVQAPEGSDDGDDDDDDDDDDPVVPDDTDIPTVDIDPGAPMDVEELTLYPADGSFAYEEDALILKAFAPEASENVKFTFDSQEIENVKNVKNMYYVAIDSMAVSNGNHTFKADITLNGESISKTSDFYYYSAKKTLVYNDFQFAGSNAAAADIAACESDDPSPAIWSLGAPCTVGSDTTGNKWLHFETHLTSEGYPEIRIGLNNEFFGYDVVGANNGISEGIVTTEFDIRMNLASGMSLNGSGASGTNYSSYYGTTSVWRIFNPNGTFGNSSKSYTYGENAQWGHVKVITDYENNSWSYYYNDELIYQDTNKPAAYGIVNQWEMYGLKIQCYGKDVSYDLDNFKISHSVATKIGNTTFNSLTVGEAATRYDGHFSPRNYSFSADHASGAVTAVQGQKGTGNVAVHMAVNGSANPNFKFYYQNKPYKGATTGALSASFDIKLDNFADVGMSGGFGLHFTSPVFGANGKVGTIPYEKDTWYNVKYYADWDKNKAYIYVNDCLVSTFDNIPYPMLNNEYFQILVWNNENLIAGEGITVDNISFTYYTLPEIKNVSSAVGEDVFDGKISRKATSVTFPLTSEFVSLEKEDITVKVDSEILDAENITLTDNEITLSFDEAIGVNKEIVITIGKDEIVKTISPVGRDYKVVFTSEDYPEEGYSISISKDGTTATADANFYFIENSDSFYVAIASYVGDKLDKIDIALVTPESDKEESYNPSISEISADADFIKAFIWSDVLKPLEIADLDLTSVE